MSLKKLKFVLGRIEDMGKEENASSYNVLFFKVVEIWD